MAKGNIHPSAIIDPSATIHPDSEIGPFCVIGPNVRIGAETKLFANAIIVQNTTIGERCQIHSGAVIGGTPQDTKFRGEESHLIIGDDNLIREFVTIHRATGEGLTTRIGDHNMVMAYCHIAHNCVVGSHITISSYAGMSGHVTVEDYANLGASSGIHQFCRIGKLAMVAGMAGVLHDVPPYMLVIHAPAKVMDINVRGLRRAGISPKVRGELRAAYKLLYRNNMNQSQALDAIEENIESSPELTHLLDFIRTTRDGLNGRGNTAPAL